MAQIENCTFCWRHHFQWNCFEDVFLKSSQIWRVPLRRFPTGAPCWISSDPLGTQQKVGRFAMYLRLLQGTFYYLYLVGGFSPTHVKNMRKSNWIISQVGVKINTIWNHLVFDSMEFSQRFPPKTYHPNTVHLSRYHWMSIGNRITAGNFIGTTPNQPSSMGAQIAGYHSAFFTATVFVNLVQFPWLMTRPRENSLFS